MMSTNRISPALVMLSVFVLFQSLCFSQASQLSLDDDIDLFVQALDQTPQDSTEAIELGNRIFSELNRKYSLSSGFINLKSRLQSAAFLADKMQSELVRSMNRRLLEIADEHKHRQTSSLVVAPAKSFYDSSTNLFSRPIIIENLPENEKAFLSDYYNLVLARHIENISLAGLGYAVAEPQFTGTYDYALVLPLLHSPEDKGVNVDMLPVSMKNPKLLNQLSDSAMFHFGRVAAAMSLARYAFVIGGRTFDEIDYYIESAKKCPPGKARIAVDCLSCAIELADVSETDRVVQLHIQIIDTWQKSDNYALAAGHARQVYSEFPDHPETGYVIWLYYYSLSLDRQGQAILADIDSHIDSPVCSGYRANLLYTKWWAMRLIRSNLPQLEALEYQLMKDYSDNSIIAPVILSRATDMISRQDYRQAHILLNQLVEKFPDTKSADQARKIMEKLKARSGDN